MDLYASLSAELPAHRNDWFGNTRWFVRINGDENSFTVCAAPVNRSHGDLQNNGRVLNKTFFSLRADAPPQGYTVKPDTVADGYTSLTVPFGEYGLIARSQRRIHVDFDCGLEKENLSVCGLKNTVAVSDGIYRLYFVCEGKIEMEPHGFQLIPQDGGVRIAVGYGVSEERARGISERLFEREDEAVCESRRRWNEYFESCPVVETGNFGRTVQRQYWCWWCLLVNVSDIEFNDFETYMSPEKTGWLGVWSNDGPECMAALSLTGCDRLARRMILGYLEKAMDDAGRHAWYTHADGQRCFGRAGDPGRLSNGAVCIAHTVGFYVRNTGDIDFLKEKLSTGQTVYERLKIYISAVYRDRDINGDALIEWANLWESGWDDKLGCFFSKKSLAEWWQAIEQLDGEQFSRFYEENSCPVTTIVEQVYMLWALSEMRYLAKLMGDAELESYCLEKHSETLHAVTEKCWSESDGFYHDLDVNGQKQIPAKSADVFYFLYFEKNRGRCEKIYRHLLNPREFGLKCIPMQSADAEGFDPSGYWSGGHWPREMSYLCMGLSRAGFQDKAEEILLKAIESGEGNAFYEVLNPITGRQSTAPTKMAYDIMDIVALLDLKGMIRWTPELSGE